MESKKETTLDIREIVSVARRRKWLLIVPMILVTVLALAGSFLMEKRYESSTMVLIDQTKFLSRELQALVPGQGEGEGWVAETQRQDRLNAIRNEITSSADLSRLIDELSLGTDPKVQRKAQQLNAERPDVSVQELVYRILIEDLRKDIRVDFNGQSIIQITAESSSPQKAMNIATKLAEIFKDEQFKRDLKGVRGAMNFSDEQLSIYKKNLDEAEQKRADFASTYLRDQLDEAVASDTNLRAINADIDNIKILIDDNIREQTRLRTELSNYKASQLELTFGKEYDRIRDEIYSETQRLAEYMSRYKWSDPKVLNANLSINDHARELENIVAQKVKEQFSSASADDISNLTRYFAFQTRELVLRKKMSDFQVSLSTLRNRVSRQPQYEVQMRNLENDARSAREVYEAFKSQLTGSEISQSLVRDESESKYRIIEPAAVPLTPVKPNRLKITGLGFVLGMVIGGAALFIMELMDRSFRRVEEVEDYLGVPVLAAIPKIDSLKKFGKKIHA
jgi:uncharacterized protein involved in exopolysaccharide biosynthesis